LQAIRPSNNTGYQTKEIAFLIKSLPPNGGHSSERDPQAPAL
jgi:hypothetical protein